MSWDLEKQILQRALSAGLLRVDQLVEKGVLDAQAVENLLDLVEPSETQSSVSGDGEPQQSESLGRYLNLEFIGEGAMARVYKAHDPVLQRSIALKILKLDEPDLKTRLLKEARAQARIEHPHVCKVYEAGEIDGKVYISMQYLPGKMLRDIAESLNLEEKIRLIQEVSEALHFAHRAGLIHRDIKPANIIVVQNEDGVLVPYVVDFGVVRELHAPGSTMTGALVGSPSYMSPEQAMGDWNRLDRRSDVFSLGAVLYEILAGKKPFENENTLRVLQMVVEEDPEPPRKINSAIPLELETVILKCLEKDPDRRYESAKALSEDLRRYLEGDPVLARRSSVTYRIQKYAARHKTEALISAVALLLVLVLGGLGIRARLQASEQAQIAQLFGQEVERVQGVVRQSYLLPLHNTLPARQLLREKLKWISEQMLINGKSAYGPGHFALGKGYIALGDYAAAEINLSKAWTEFDYQRPEVAYSLGLALAVRFSEGLAEADRITGKEEREAKKREVEKLYREPAFWYLNRGRQAQTESPEYIEALLAYLSRRYETALQKARSASAAIPWLYEADLLRGNIYRAMATDPTLSRNPDEMEGLYQKAEGAYREAAEKAESDPVLYEALCSLGTQKMIFQNHYRTDIPEAMYRQAMTYCDSALVADSQSFSAYASRALVQVRWGSYLAENGSAAAPVLEQAIVTATRATELNPRSDSAFGVLGDAYSWKAWNAMTHGLDPTAASQKSLEAYRKSVGLNQNAPGVLNNYCGTYLDRYEYEISKGIDPRKTLMEGIETCEKAVSIAPRNSSPRSNLGMAYWDMATWESEHGIDAGPSFQKSQNAFKEGLLLDPKRVAGYGNLGGVYIEQAGYLVNLKQDPGEPLRKARENLNEAMKRNPGNFFVMTWLVSASAVEAEHLLQIGMDPTPVLKDSFERLSQVIAADPERVEVYIVLAKMETMEARYESSRGKSPSSSFAKARAALKTLFGIESRSARGWNQSGWTELAAYDWSLKEHHPLRSLLTDARHAFETSIEIKPDFADSYQGIAQICLNEAQLNAAQNPSSDSGATVRQGIEAAEKALSIDSRANRAPAILASLRQRLPAR